MVPEYFTMASIPDATLKEAANLIKPYATALSWDGRLVGSGTFVRINGRSGILTARHVWDVIDRARAQQPEVNLIVADGPHRFRITVDHLTPWVALSPVSIDLGPDIQFLELPAAVIGRIAARKSFAELTATAGEYRAIALGKDGFGVVAGFPGEFVSQELPADGGDITAVFAGGFVAPIDRHWEEGGYDYMETTALRTLKGIPTSFGGVSGAGLWQMVLKKKAGAPIAEATLGKFALAGVAYLQIPTPPDKMVVRYHGPETIYGLLNKIVPEI